MNDLLLLFLEGMEILLASRTWSVATEEHVNGY